jgi:hypothetical protein
VPRISSLRGAALADGQVASSANVWVLSACGLRSRRLRLGVQRGNSVCHLSEVDPRAQPLIEEAAASSSSRPLLRSPIAMWASASRSVGDHL